MQPKYRYVPFLRWKQGEHDALANLLPATKASITPLIKIGSDTFKEKPASKKNPSVPAPAHFAAQVLTFWGKAPFFLDASAIPEPHDLPHPIYGISDAIKEAGGGPIIPVTRRHYEPSYTNQVFALAEHTKSGVGFVVKPGELLTIKKWVDLLLLPTSVIDLMVDFADDIALAQSLKDPVVEALAAVWATKPFRSVTFIGTSMPDSLAGVKPGAFEVDRDEWAFWQGIASQDTPFRPDYGDYATVSVLGPPGTPVNVPVNAKYTLPKSFLICKGVKTAGLGAVKQSDQFRAHAQTIVAAKAKGALGLPSCWGDDRITAINNGTAKGPGNYANWVSYSVNRHIELVRHQLP